VSSSFWRYAPFPVSRAELGPFRLSQLQQQAMQARMAQIVGAENYNRLFAGVAFGEVADKLLYAFAPIDVQPTLFGKWAAVREWDGLDVQGPFALKRIRLVVRLVSP
jgi:hypothetical protein